MPDETKASKTRIALYLLAFLSALSSALPAYINSSFLHQYIGESLVGIVYTAGSIFSVICFSYMAYLMRRFGNYRVSMMLICLIFLSTIALAFIQNPLLIFVSFILNFTTIALIGLNLDLFLERFSKDTKTGTVRGTFLTAGNTAWVIAPTLGAFFLAYGSFPALYVASAVVLIPILLILFVSLRKFSDPEYPSEPYWRHLSLLWKDRNMKSIFIIYLLLQFFYAWMVIYTPIYLNETIGFSWSTIGVMFSIMLIPFVILDVPLGRIADKFLGEKELLVAGFAVMGISTGLIAFITDHNVLLWGAVLFMTRVGAATVEVMADTYFFKKVDASSIYLISLFRTVRPLAYIVSPVIATLLFVALDLKGLFVVLGILMFYGIRHSLALEDTK